MTRARCYGLLLLLLSGGIFIMWGLASQYATQERSVVGGMGDFKLIYGAARCLLQHNDPYSQNAIEGFYQSEQWTIPPNPVLSLGATLYLYFPTVSIFIAPFAMLPWGPAHVLWMMLTAAGLILAAFLMWNIAANRTPGVSLFLICILLANCEVVFSSGNAAGIAVSLCVVAVWCFLKERFVQIGILCMAVSLCIKPHDAGPVWLYFMLVGGVYRKRAQQTLVMTIVLGLAGVLWVSHIAPHWMQELHSNTLANSMHGYVNDPGPAEVHGPNPDGLIDLQTVISIFRDDPRIYNPVSYLICGAPLLIWLVRTVRSCCSATRVWFALAAIVPLSILPIYHRGYDAKLLLLTIPACAILWAKGGPIRWVALVVTTAGIVLTADIPLVILNIFTKNLHVDTVGIFGKILTVVLMRPVPLILLVMAIFYLWVYVRRDPGGSAMTKPGGPGGAPIASMP